MVGTVGTYYPACKRAVHHADTDNAITVAGPHSGDHDEETLASIDRHRPQAQATHGHELRPTPSGALRRVDLLAFATLLMGVVTCRYCVFGEDR